MTPSISRLCRVAAAALVLAAVSLGPSWAGAATGPGDEAVAVSPGGLVVQGGFSGAGDDKFAVMFVIPDARATGTAESGGVSFTKPWASVEKSDGRPGDLGSERPCSTVTNPRSWSAGRTVKSPEYVDSGRDPLDGIYFDVSCGDGEFDFYRIHFDAATSVWSGQPQGVYATRTNHPDLHYWGTAVQQSGAGRGALVVRSEAKQTVDMSVCGFANGRFRCLDSDGASGGQLAFVTAMSVLKD